MPPRLKLLSVEMWSLLPEVGTVRGSRFVRTALHASLPEAAASQVLIQSSSCEWIGLHYESAGLTDGSRIMFEYGPWSRP